MNQDERSTAVIIGICSDVANLVSAWEAVTILFTEYAETLIKILESGAEQLMISEPSHLSGTELDDLFKQLEENSATLIATSPKKYGMSLRRGSQRVSSYNYIPRAIRNRPYQRRAY